MSKKLTPYDCVMRVFESQSQLSRMTAIPRSTIASWKSKLGGYIPRWNHSKIQAAAQSFMGKRITTEELSNGRKSKTRK